MRTSRIRLWLLLLVTLFTLAVVLAVGGRAAQSEPAAVQHSAPPQTRIYKHSNTLENLPALLRARRALAGSKPSAEEAAQAATLALSMFQSSGNARFLGAANSAIAAWQDTPQPPPEVWVLRARLLQTQHRFADAAQDLAAFNRQHSGSSEALLLEADAWRRAGMIAQSRRVCLRLALQGRADLASFCAADVLLTVGAAEDALSLMAPVIDSATALPPAERDWGLAIYADALVANGESEQAVSVWESMDLSTAAPLSYRLAFADVLLSLSRNDAVLALLDEDTQSTAALLRLTVAASRLGHANAASWRSVLQRRLALVEHTDSADLHLREQALSALWLDGNAEESLQLALRNWASQKGWEDTQLVLHIATRLRRDEEIRRIHEWQESQAMGGET